MAALIYTVAQGGYGAAWAACIRSQAAYAERIGATFICITKPSWVEEPSLSAWLKVPILRYGLDHFDEVAYLDADCEVKEDAPDFRRELAIPEGSIRMGLGRSGRYNSGVIIARADDVAKAFVDRVLETMTEAIPDEDRHALKYENGNIIYAARTMPGILELDRRWNNSENPELDDYIRHYAGPMRATYRRGTIDRVRFEFAKLRRPATVRQPQSRSEDFRSSLAELTAKVLATYPAIVRTQ